MSRRAKSLALEIVGWVLLVAGAAALVLPGPGLLMVFSGMILLAQRYAWANRWLRPVNCALCMGRPRVFSHGRGSRSQPGSHWALWRRGCFGRSHRQRPRGGRCQPSGGSSAVLGWGSQSRPRVLSRWSCWDGACDGSGVIPMLWPNCTPRSTEPACDPTHMALHLRTQDPMGSSKNKPVDVRTLRRFATAARPHELEEALDGTLRERRT